MSTLLPARPTRCLCRQVVGDALSPGVYDVQIKTRGAPVLARTRMPAQPSMLCKGSFKRTRDLKAMSVNYYRDHNPWTQEHRGARTSSMGACAARSVLFWRGPCDGRAATGRRARVQTESGQELRQRMVNSKLSVGELAATALVALPPVVRVAALAGTLRACGHQAFPVTPEVKAALQSGARAVGAVRAQCDAVKTRVHAVVASYLCVRHFKGALHLGRIRGWWWRPCWS